MSKGERGECFGRSDGFVAEEKENAHRLGFADHLDQVEFEQRELRRLFSGPLADYDVDQICLGLTLEPRGDVGVVAEHRIVKALIRTEITDNALAGIEPD